MAMNAEPRAQRSSGSHFVTFWHGKELTALEWVCIKSFINQGHSYHLYAYGDVDVPAGVQVKPANEILPRQQLFYFEGSPSAFSNLFRYKLLAQTTAWWVDTDVYYCGRRLPDVDYCWAEEEPGQINGAVLKLGPDAHLPETLYEVALQRSSALTRWGQLGPALLTEYLGSRRPTSYYGGQEHIYPIHWLEAYYYWLPEFYTEIRSRASNSLFHHFWNSILIRTMDIKANFYPPEGSFLADLYRAHAPLEPDTVPISAKDIRERIVAYLSHDWVKNACTKRGIVLKPPTG